MKSEFLFYIYIFFLLKEKIKMEYSIRMQHNIMYGMDMMAINAPYDVAINK